MFTPKMSHETIYLYDMGYTKGVCKNRRPGR